MTVFDELESMWTQLCVETTAGDDAEEETRARRARCETCGRPSVACPCAHLPAEPTHTRGALIVLTHPNERKRALATGWILPECFRRCAVVTKREPPSAFLRMFADENDADSDSDDSSSSSDARPIVPRDVPVYVLYPASNAEDVDRVDPVADREAFRREASSFRRSEETREEKRSSRSRASEDSAKTPPAPRSRAAALRELTNARDALRGAAYVLIALDSTWGQAREMAAAAMSALPPRTKLVKLPAARADAPGLRGARLSNLESAETERERSMSEDPSMSEARADRADRASVSPSTVLRVEPELGCVLTAEACARAMERLERVFPRRADTGETRTSPASAAVATIRAMARVQSAHDPAMRAGATKVISAGKYRQRIAAARNLVRGGRGDCR